MEKKERVFWTLFYIFPIVGNIILAVGYYADAGNNYEVNKIVNVGRYNVIYYHKYHYEYEKDYHIYALESSIYRVRDFQNADDYYKHNKLAKGDFFLRFNIPNGTWDDQSVDISYNKEEKELIVRYNLPEECIYLKKNKIHGIKVTYIPKYEEKKKNE